MRVGIYNRYLHTIGGGERYTLSLAEHLAKTHEVEVFTHQLVDRADLERKLEVDLSRVTLRFIPDLPEEELSEYTGRFDLFVNATFQSLLPSRAPKSLLIVYFPTPVTPSVWPGVRRGLGLALKRTLIIPEFIQGFYPPDRLGRTEFCWTSGRSRIRIPVPAGRRSLRVDLVLGRPLGLAAPGADLICSANGTYLKTVRVRSSDAMFTREELLLDHVRDGVAELDLSVREPVQIDPDGRQLGVAILDVRVHHPRYWAYYVLFRRMFPRIGHRLAVLRTSSPDARRNLASYRAVCAISRYAQGWIRRYWGVSSLLLPPPAPVEMLVPGPKKRQILSVGRFFWGSHNKKHREMIHVFRALQRQGHLPGWELHLAGTVTPGAVHEAYLAQVRAAAIGAPVSIHTDIAFEGLRRLYGESRIYWHACGYNEDEERAPEKFEHFGITTVEAMAAGCIPIVIARGGQREIVRHGVDGFLWENLDQLKRSTIRIAEDGALARDLAARAVERSRDFGTDVFRRRLDQIVAAI